MFVMTQLYIMLEVSCVLLPLSGQAFFCCYVMIRMDPHSNMVAYSSFIVIIIPAPWGKAMDRDREREKERATHTHTHMKE